MDLICWQWYSTEAMLWDGWHNLCSINPSCLLGSSWCRGTPDVLSYISGAGTLLMCCHLYQGQGHSWCVVIYIRAGSLLCCHIYQGQGHSRCVVIYIYISGAGTLLMCCHLYQGQGHSWYVVIYIRGRVTPDMLSYISGAGSLPMCCHMYISGAESLPVCCLMYILGAGLLTVCWHIYQGQGRTRCVVICIYKQHEKLWICSHKGYGFVSMKAMGLSPLRLWVCLH